jgi:peptidoglycan/LPS O-acetylase OafA/YrhL
VNRVSPARFPPSLILQEKRYLAAAESGQAAEASAARAALGAGIEAQLASDRQRLLELKDRSGSRSERDFLRARVALLEPRLESLRHPGDPLAQTAAPAAPWRHAQPVAPWAPTEPTEPTPAAEPPVRAVSSGRRSRGRVPEQRVHPAHRDEEDTQEEVKPRHRNDIQGLRAVAVVLVALAHAGVGFLKGGFVGVDVFFVLSGFLITGLLVSEARRRRYVSLAEFYLRRARRILPAATLTLIVTDLAAYHLLNIVRAKQYLTDSISSVFFAANFHFAAQGTNYFAQGQPPSPFQHFWSLAVEEQFYVVWPALFVLVLGLAFRRYAPRPTVVRERAIRRVFLVVVAIGAASLLFSIIYTSSSPAAAYFSTPARVWELALGAALALGGSRLAGLPDGWRAGMGWAGLVCIVIAAVTYSGATAFPGYAALLPTVGAALLIAAGLAQTSPRLSAGRVLGVLPLRYVGDRSYAFYLWHWPVLVIVAQHAGHNLSVGENLLLLLAAFALSIVSYRLFESPIRNSQWTRKGESAVAWVASVMAVLILATVYVSSINNRETRQRLAAEQTPASVLALAPQPATTTAPIPGAAPSNSSSQVLPAVVKAVTDASARRSVPAVLNPPVGQLLNDLPNLPANCIAHDGQTQASICRLGATASSRMIAVIGDSHAEMWLPAIVKFAQQDGWVVVPIMKSACTPPLWPHGSGQCPTWFRWAMHEGSVLHPDVTLIAGHYSYRSQTADDPATDQLLSTALNGAVVAMKKASKHVAIIADIPELARQPVDCLLASHATLASCSETLAPSEPNLTSVVAQLAAADGVGVIDPTGWFCYQEQCPLVVGNLITYRDTDHVSATYAAALSAAFRAEFNLAIKS